MSIRPHFQGERGEFIPFLKPEIFVTETENDDAADDLDDAAIDVIEELHTTLLYTSTSQKAESTSTIYVEEGRQQQDPVDYPANCYVSTGDGYSGWFSTSAALGEGKDKKCTDFCFWDYTDSDVDDDKYSVWNTDDPHQSTTAPDLKSVWKCSMDVDSDEVSWNSMLEQATPYALDEFEPLRCRGNAGETLRYTSSFITSPAFWSILLVSTLVFFGVELYYLHILWRENKIRKQEPSLDGDNTSTAGDVEDNKDKETNHPSSSQTSQPQPENAHSNSATTTITTTTSIGSTSTNNLSMSQMDGGSKGIANTASSTSSARNPSKDADAPLRLGEESPLDESKILDPSIDGKINNSQNESDDYKTEKLGNDAQQKQELGTDEGDSPKPLSPKNQIRKRWILGFIWIFANVFVGFAFFWSILNLVELSGAGKDTSTFTLKQLTPACTDHNVVCPKANTNIFRESSSQQENDDEGSFSYLIASDVQLDWYSGESAYIGRRNFPPGCNEQMSCGECTTAFAQHSNSQMKQTIEKLLNSKEGGAPTISMENGAVTPPEKPVPQTLVVNGDLTAYFHRNQMQTYESFYHNIEGLTNYFPGLGNHDIDVNDGGFQGDQWIGSQKPCNAAHGMMYLKGGFCGNIPNFDPLERLTRYHAGSLAYSWEQGNYHFVHLHYYPTYEHSDLGLASSMEWLEQDLIMAHEAGLASILFVHAAEGLTSNQVLKRVLLGRNVKAIFAGHTHRCLFRKCEGLSRLNVAQAENPILADLADKCLPATISLCGSSAAGNFQSLFYLKDADPDLEILPPAPERELYNTEPDKTSLCPQSYPVYINETDQTLLCRRYVFNSPDFTIDEEETIPLFWSGSASYETLLQADFHSNRFVVNVLTAEQGFEGELYADSHPLPNAVYPYHNKTDLDEVVIYL